MKSITGAIDYFPRSPLYSKQMDEKSIIRGWKFNKTIIPFALVEYEIGNNLERDTWRSGVRTARFHAKRFATCFLVL